MVKQTKMDSTPLIAGGIIGGIFGFFSSQYFPFWGGLLSLGMPFSEVRLQLAPAHVLVFLIGGIICGFLYNKYGKK